MSTRLMTLVMMTMIMFLVFGGCSSDPGPEVWVIGVDGADWDQLGPMIDRGELPNFAALREGGAWGILRSDMPMISPILWTSIATGKTPDVHGVTWFMSEGPDGSMMPISSYEREVRTFWNIASEADRTCGIVGWWATWPAEPINGWLASDYVAWHSFGVTGRSSVDQGKTWPPEFMTLIEGIMPSPMDIPSSLVERMVNLPASEMVPDATKGPYEDPAAHLRQAIATSRGFTDVILHQLDHDRTELMSIYYEGTDAITHIFGDYQDPRLPWVSDEDYAAYKDVINEYWKWQDELLGELLAKRGPQTTVIVCSDHGFRIGDERRKEDNFNIETADADHMPDGMIIINGPDVQPGVRLRGADIYDVAPTTLYAMDLAVGNDMAGHVLSEAFTRESLKARPIATVTTYETSPLVRTEGIEGDEEARENLEMMLRSLGYISGADGGTESEISSAEQTVNLSTVLMRQGRFAEAVDTLRETLLEHPGHKEIRLNLAQALARSGDLAGSEEIYRELVSEDPQRLEFHQDLAICVGQSGNYSGALEAIDAGLAINPEWVEGLTARGWYLFHLGRTDEAQAVLEKSLGMDPRQSQAHFNLGQVLAAKGDMGRATASLEKAHDLDPGSSRTAVALAGVLERQGNYPRALEILNRTLELGGDDPAVLGEIGAVLIRNGKPSEAVAPLEQAQKLAPGSIDVAGNLGMAYAMTGKMPAAIKAFEKVVALQPGLAEGHSQLGSLYHQAGKFEDARRAYSEAIRLDPEMAPAYYNLGLLERSMGNTAEGQELIDRAREMDPSLTER